MTFNEWLPIDTYDKLKKKPGFAVFYVAEIKKRHRNNYGLPETIALSRSFGSRDVTHWMPLPEPPK